MFCPFTQNKCGGFCALSDGAGCALARIADALESIAFDSATIHGEDDPAGGSA